MVMIGSVGGVLSTYVSPFLTASYLLGVDLWSILDGPISRKIHPSSTLVIRSTSAFNYFASLCAHSDCFIASTKTRSGPWDSEMTVCKDCRKKRFVRWVTSILSLGTWNKLCQILVVIKGRTFV